MIRHLRFSLTLSLLLLVLISFETFAQVEPDTIRRKQELPTGPPVLTEPQRPRQQPRVTEQPQQPPVEARAESQEGRVEQEELLIDRLYYGGSFGLRFGTFTNITLLPIIGYRVTEKFSVGGGVVYHFIRQQGITLHNYGARAFSQLELFNLGDGAILAHAEFEYLRRGYLVLDSNGYLLNKLRATLHLPMAGIGYRQRISDKASFDMLLLYNFNDEPLNPYSNPVIRAGFNIPFR